MSQAIKYLLAYLIAFLIPVYFYGYHHLNESNVFLTFLIPAVTFFFAGLVTADIGNHGRNQYKWVAWSTLFGLILGAIALLTI